MPLQQTPSGLQIESLQEIVAGFEADFQDPTTGFGADAPVAPNTVFGQFIGIMSERFATLEQLAQKIQSGFDPNFAAGTDLDVLCEITGTERGDERQSESAEAVITGTPATNILDLSEVQNATTEDIWQIINGPYVIGGGGTVTCTIRARDPGPLTFSATTVWNILTPLSGWASFSTPTDIDPEDIGSAVESDEELRQRREDELFSGGNDLDAIKAEVTKVVNVLEVTVYENRDSCNTSPDGIPPGAIETVVEGGDDTLVAEAILSAKPPGTEAFGQTVTINLTDDSGNNIPIGITRPTDIAVSLIITITTVGAEAPLPDNPEVIIGEAVLEFANANTRIGQDVVPGSFAGIVWDLLKDPATGLYSASSVIVQGDFFPPVGITTDPLIINIRERADYDSTRITVNIT